MSATAYFIYLRTKIVSEILQFVQFASLPRGGPSVLAHASFSWLCWKVLFTYYPSGFPSSHPSLLLVCQLVIAFHNLLLPLLYLKEILYNFCLNDKYLPCVLALMMFFIYNLHFHLDFSKKCWEGGEVVNCPSIAILKHMYFSAFAQNSFNPCEIENLF